MPVNKKSPDVQRDDAIRQRVARLIAAHGLVTAHDTVVVGVSGGPDSVALLHILHHLGRQRRLVAVYVDHGLRPDETGAEHDLVAEFCRRLNVPFVAEAIDVAAHRRQTGESLEAAARTLRYQALEGQRRRFQAAAIAVAHTADDQAEEVLIRLIRGTGRQGLSGMAVRRGAIIRPLLQETKKSLCVYLTRHDIPYCLDSSNALRTFLRNRVRLDLLPYLERRFNPAIRRNLLQTAEILNAEEDLLAGMTEESCRRLLTVSQNTNAPDSPPERIRIASASLRECHLALQRRILESICWKMGTRPGFRQINALCGMIAEGKTGAELHLGTGLRVWKTATAVVFSHPDGRKGFRGSGAETVLPTVRIEQSGRFSVGDHILEIRRIAARPEVLQDGQLLVDGDRISFPLQLRPPLPGERFRPLGATGGKKIGRFFTAAKIPLRDRRHYPVLVAGDTIIAVAGLRIDHDFRLRDDSRHILLIDWRKV